MINYDTIANTSGAFPNVVGLNATGPSATDGTPYIKALIDDYWGANQALMNHAGLTPDAVTESSSASQRLTALQYITGGPGTVVAWMGNDADPATAGRRMLPLNGQGILRASYADLDDTTYVGDGNNATASAFYHADDAAGTSRNIIGVYLILPESRGYGIRGLDSAGTVDPQGASRDIGSLQDWTIVEHDHYVWDPANDYIGAVAAIDWDLTTVDKFAIEMTSSVVESNTDIMADSIPTGTVPAINQDVECRMTNIAARWAIIY
jgi:hypothetical protein